MSRRRSAVPRRRRIFVTAEGESERALAKWLQRLCDQQELHIHIDTVVAGGGDTRSVVEYAVDQRRRHIESRGRDIAALVFLDRDRLAQDRTDGRDPDTVEGREHLELIYLTPNFEGFLFRLFSDHEQQFLRANEAERRLRRLWPGYDKPVSANALAQRFDLGALQRAAVYDANLRSALTLVGLLR